MDSYAFAIRLRCLAQCSRKREGALGTTLRVHGQHCEQPYDCTQAWTASIAYSWTWMSNVGATQSTFNETLVTMGNRNQGTASPSHFLMPHATWCSAVCRPISASHSASILLSQPAPQPVRENAAVSPTQSGLASCSS
jgi:hypothetical protein